MVRSFDGGIVRILYALAVLIGMAAPAAAVQAYTLGPTISTTTGRATQSLAGTYNVAAGSATISTATIVLNGVTGGISATSATLTGAFRAGSISGADITAGTIDTAKLAADSVITAKIINAAVDTAKHATDSVTTAKILNAAINTSKLATDSVTGSSILNGTISAAKLSFTPGTGDAILNSTQTFSGTNTFASNPVKASSGVIAGTAVGSFVAPFVGVAVNGFGVLVSSTAAPTCGSGVGGATCTINPGANNQSGSMTLAGSGTGITLTFASPGWKSITACVWTMGGSNVAIQQSSLSNTAAVVSWGGGVNGNLYWICFGAP